MLSIKITVDSLASIQASVSNVELFCNTRDGLSGEYELLVTAITVPISFDELRTKSIFYEQ